MSYDVLKLCKDMGEYFEVDPEVMFPATIKRIQEVVKGDTPTEIVSKGWEGNPWYEPTVKGFVEQAGEIRSWNTADALAFAQSWFKRALVLKVEHGVRIHISKNLDWKR